MNNLVQSQAISVFNFKSTPVRTQLIDGNIWFCLIDVCDSLNLRRGSKVVDRLEEAGVRKTSLSYPSGAKEVSFINEPNLYRLIFRSNKPAAVQFGNWVYEEVLPTIRKTGSYGVSAQVDMKAIGGMVKKCCAVAVREEISKAYTYRDILNNPQNIMQQLNAWFQYYHSQLISDYEKLNYENQMLKLKLERIQKAINA